MNANTNFDTIQFKPQKPQFIYNNHTIGKKVLSVIEEQLQHCDEFFISVAFITMGGIAPLLQTLKELEKKHIKGRILTTDYLAFNDPKALNKLASFSNIELRMFFSEDANIGFHTKGYIFKKEQNYNIIVGSSNLTASALTLNQEWNTKIASWQNEEYTHSVLQEFERLWNNENTLCYPELIQLYMSRYQTNAIRKEYYQQLTSEKNTSLSPNPMQKAFIQQLKSIYESGEDRALLISATGTGKTYASAFGVKELNPRKVLFLVHREQIAKQARKSYQRIFGNTKTYGLLSGNHKDFDCDILFATMQTMAKEDIQKQFATDTFDVIVIDEAHRIGANSYQKILDYFTPRFWLGMTASPERTDDFDVYAAFHHNIAYEIRLQQALEEDLLCPFHYFGITDLYINEQEDTSLQDFNRLASEQRVDYIMEQAHYYGYSGDRVKGLIFCSSLKEAQLISNKLNERGYRTLPLGGGNTQEERERAVERLVSDSKEDALDYILTVDIFNEGVDIPEINQVILLRPTESPIVFVQQLGRGLRKNKDKEYVIILDFIGNYKNNFMIPIALSGDRSYNKDNIRRYVMEGERMIPGSSTIHFDEISKKQIFSSIDSADFSENRLLKEKYTNLKFKIGRIPTLMDFDTYGEIDPCHFYNAKKHSSYYTFLAKQEKEYTIRFSPLEAKFIEYIGSRYMEGKRPHELFLLQEMFTDPNNLFARLQEKLPITNVMRTNLINQFTNQFMTGANKKSYADCIFIEADGNDYKVSQTYQQCLKNPEFYSTIEELITFGLYRNQKNYPHPYKDTNFVLYQKYTYEDVCRMLNWQQSIVPLNIGGYKYDKDTHTFPVFINYDKGEDIQDTIRYEDHFLNPTELISISKSGRDLNSEDVQNFLHSEERGIEVTLFVRKNKDDKSSKEFYFLGSMKPVPSAAKEFTMRNTNTKAVEMLWTLDTEVREDIYTYITESQE